jgi:cephalosporin hydroxylase
MMPESFTSFSHVGNNPKTAVYEWAKIHPEFEIDKEIDNKLLVSVAPDGYLKRIA